ncbi:WAP, Kazal, immunoglobulin, Kunitz and NTR domain-containing protein 2 [Callorhinchus milii]|nr:WAP, Kazal, immunoglobulin, Kunitz and NTR domain-containing protein 2 [Callorhinchus milii]|eukprot:gi/632981065/ref/XP_007907385.1/ PREDICTED: WAP, Kazal, immunoglobulin, Kunitz and NTR domain-containing protein 2 [Callorhinchus milii]
MGWTVWSRWRWMALRAMLMVLFLPMLVENVAVARIKYSHAGICPNEMTPSLWVDAQSTCSRECETDQDCETFEKCCPNVCGMKSCVAARYMDIKGRKGPSGMPVGGNCDRFMCTQQGSECDIWDGQPVCKCKERCEKEPHFTCASDGLTYYNKCYMDAEACTKGITLTVVTCTYHLIWPNTSPIPLETTEQPTTAYSPTTSLDVLPPALLSNPGHQSMYVGGTVSFLCDVNGRPKPEITWEKQLDGRENIIMRPNHVNGNVVVTNIGQLVIYNAQLQDAGIYTCTARNTGGLLRADFPLSVIKTEDLVWQNATQIPAEECLKQPDRESCDEAQVKWYYDHKKNNCFTFNYGQCEGNMNHFEMYEECMSTCMNEPVNICTLPALQGPCKAWEPRWAYNSLMRQCQSFIYGGCGGNENNFESRETCEEICPYPRSQQCKVCKPRFKIVTSFCKSDFVIVGHMTELTEDTDSGRALFTVHEVLKDEKMGLQFFGSKILEITLLNMDWQCPCPNMTTADGPLIVMGDAHNGMAVLQPHSFVRTVNERRTKKLKEVKDKKTCELLREFTGFH